MKILKRNPFITSLVAILLMAMVIIGATFIISNSWEKKGFVKQEDMESAFGIIENYADVVTGDDFYERFFTPTDEAVVAVDSANLHYLLDENGEVIYKTSLKDDGKIFSLTADDESLSLYGDIVISFSPDKTSVTTLEELKEKKTFGKVVCTNADATPNGKYIALYYADKRNDEVRLEIVNHDFNKIYEMKLRFSESGAHEDIEEAEHFFFAENTEEDGWCYVENPTFTRSFDVNILTGEKSGWHVADNGFDDDEEEETYEGFPIWAMEKSGAELYLSGKNKSERGKLEQARWNRLHDLGLNKELERQLKKFKGVDILSENYLAAYSYKGATLIRLGGKSYE